MKTRLLLTAMALFSAAIAGHAQISELVTYQGVLASTNAPLTGSYDLRFTIYDSLAGPTVVSGPTTNSAVTVSNGLFTTQIAVSGSGAIFNGSDRFLQIEVRTNGSGTFATLVPRQQFTPTPFAFYTFKAGTANSAISVGPGAVGNAGLQDGAVTSAKIGGGNVVKTLNLLKDDVTLAAGANVTLTPSGQTLTLASPTDWHVGGNAVSSGQFLGSTNNQPLELWANGSRALRLEPAGSGMVNLIGGYSGNLITAGVVGATIAGGGDSTGWPNNIPTGANYATVSGGHGNAAGEVESTVAGGGQNRANGQKSTIGGGFGNTANGYGATVGGGYANYAVGSYSVVGGGSGNTNGNDYAVIGGGLYNTNTGPDAFLGGGLANLVSGLYAVVPGGLSNAAAGSYAFAAGRRAKAGHQGAYVWADSKDADFGSTANDQFLIRASGGVGINTNNPQSALHVVGTVTASNYVGSGAALTSLNPTNLASPIPDTGLSANVALLNANQTFSGVNYFKYPGTNSGGLRIGANVPGGEPKLIYFGDSSFVTIGEQDGDDLLELRAMKFAFLPSPGYSSANVGIGTNNPQALLHVAGTVSASAVGIGTSTPTGALLDVEGDMRLNMHDLYLREGTDDNHGLGWYGASKLFGGVNVDGPVLYGCAGGGLGSGCNTNLALQWLNNGNVIIDPQAQNAGTVTPGLTFGASSGEGIASKRTSGGNQYGLDFYTVYQRRLSLDNSGNLSVQGVVDTLGASPMEFRVNGTTALRLDQSVATNGAPNVIGGSIANSVDAGYYAATIAGGGATNWGGGAYSNRIVASFATIGGGMDNTILTNASYATIAGGYHQSIQRNATGAKVGGGYGNSIKTGASYGTIAGGNINTIQTNATYATVAGGNRNTVGSNATYSAIGGGSFNAISNNASYAVIPGGFQAAATHYGQFAFASGDLYAPGDAQTSLYVLRSQFSGSSFSSLYLDNSSQMLTIPNSAVWGFEIMVVGALNGGPSAVFKFTGAIRNYGGTVAFIGTPAKTVVGADAGASTWDAQLLANSGALDIQTKGNSSTYVSWVATVRTTEVTPTY